jgi:hypothetical protein
VLAIATALWFRHRFCGLVVCNHHHHRGGYVIPFSLDGVNPVYHPDIFCNPAVARSYGLVLGPDRAW